MYHRGNRVVEHGQHLAAPAVLETCEVLVVGRQILCCILGHSVGQAHVRGVFHQLTLQHVARSILHVRQRTHENGVVEHRREQQFSLLRVCQRLVAAGTKLVVAACEEPRKGIVIGWEDSLTTRLIQHIRITQVLNQPAVRIERTLKLGGVLKLLVDTLAKPRWQFSFWHHVVLRTGPQCKAQKRCIQKEFFHKCY